MASSLAAVRALADAEFADPAWFEPLDLAEVAEAAVADERRRGARRRDRGDRRRAGRPLPSTWRQGAQLAIANVVRNALVHGRATGAEPHVVVTVDEPRPWRSTTTAQGVPEADRARVVQRFVKGAGSGGSGLGLAIAREVAVAHGGTVDVGAGAARRRPRRR